MLTTTVIKKLIENMEVMINYFVTGAKFSIYLFFHHFEYTSEIP